jgi:hypothetical protein
MDAPQYAHDCVLLYAPAAWKFYYTHHSDMDDPQYVYVDVHLDDICH